MSSEHHDMMIERLRAMQLGPCNDAADMLERFAKALQFYADGHHFVKHDASAWDAVSGEPMNFEEDEANTATVEDGSIAKLTLEGRDLFQNDELEEPETYRGGTLFRDLSAEDKEKVNLGIITPDEKPASVRLKA